MEWSAEHIPQERKFAESNSAGNFAAQLRENRILTTLSAVENELQALPDASVVRLRVRLLAEIAKESENMSEPTSSSDDSSKTIKRAKMA